MNNKNFNNTIEFNRFPSSENSQPSCFKNICVGDEVYDIRDENIGFSGRVVEIIPYHDPESTKIRVVNNDREATIYQSWIHKSIETRGCWSNARNEDFCIDQIVSVYRPRYNSSISNIEKARIIEIPTPSSSTFLLQGIDKKFTMLLEPGSFFDMTEGRCRGEAPAFCIGSEFDNGLKSKDTVLGINESRHGVKGLIFLIKPGDNPKNLIYISQAKLLKRSVGDYKVPKGIIKEVYFDFGEKYSQSKSKNYISLAKKALLAEARVLCEGAFVESYGLGVPDINKSPFPEVMNCNYVPGGYSFSLGTVYFDPNVSKKLSKIKCDDFSWEVWCTHPLAEK